MDIFCRIINDEIDSKKIYEDDVVIVILDNSPKSNGHCLIIPKVHYTDIYDLPIEVMAHIIDVAKKIGNMLTSKLKCEGITLEQNNGIVQEVKHFHLHIIPKYKNGDSIVDTNIIYNKIIDKTS